MPLEFARELKYSDPKRFNELRALAYAHYWQGTIPIDEDLRKMLEYVNFVEDEANRTFKSYVDNYDYSTWTSWEKSVKAAWDPNKLSYSPSIGCADSVLYDSTDDHCNTDIIRKYTATNAADRETYEQRWQAVQKVIADNWVNWMSE